MKNEQLIKDIKHLEYISKDKYEVLDMLLKKDYPETEIIKTFDCYPFKGKWETHYLGFFMIGLIVFILFDMKFNLFSHLTHDSMYYFGSRKSYSNLNEYIFKPFLIVLLLFGGINSIINKGFITRTLKLFMILIFYLFLLVQIKGHFDINSIIIGVSGIIIFAFYKTKSDNIISNAQTLINSMKIKSKWFTYKGAKWKGSIAYIFFALLFIVFSKGQISTPVGYYKNNMLIGIDETLIPILISINTSLIILSLIISIFLNINTKKTKIPLIIYACFNCLFILTSLFITKLEVSLYPSTLAIVLSFIILLRNKLILKRIKIPKGLDKIMLGTKKHIFKLLILLLIILSFMVIYDLR